VARHAYRPPAPDPAERAGITPTGATPPSRATGVAGVRAVETCSVGITAETEGESGRQARPGSNALDAHASLSRYRSEAALVATGERRPRPPEGVMSERGRQPCAIRAGQHSVTTPWNLAGDLAGPARRL